MGEVWLNFQEGSNQFSAELSFVVETEEKVQRTQSYSKSQRNSGEWLVFGGCCGVTSAFSSLHSIKRFRACVSPYLPPPLLHPGAQDNARTAAENR